MVISNPTGHSGTRSNHWREVPSRAYKEALRPYQVLKNSGGVTMAQDGHRAKVRS